MKKQIIFFCITMLVVALLGGISVAQAATYNTPYKTYSDTRVLNGNYMDSLDQSYEGQGALYSLCSVVDLTGKTATTAAVVPNGNVTLPGVDNFYVTIIVESNKGFSANDTVKQNAAGGGRYFVDGNRNFALVYLGCN